MVLLKIIFTFLIIYGVLYAIKRLIEYASVENYKDMWIIGGIDFLDDLGMVLDKWNMKYEIEKDVDGKRMMVILRKPDDPFFHVVIDKE